LGTTPRSEPEATASQPSTSPNDDFDFETWLNAESDPASIDIEVDESTAAKATIGREGGELETSDANGTAYKLMVPAGALFSSVEITMTPLSSAGGDPIGDSPIAGVRLEPEGLYFLGYATLEINGDLADADAVGFGAEGQGEDFHLLPTQVDAGSVNMPILHFSVAGIGKAQLAESSKDYKPTSQASAMWIALEYGKAIDGNAVVLTLQLWGNGLADRMGSTGAAVLENQTLEMISIIAISEKLLKREDLGDRAEVIRDIGRKLSSLWNARVSQEIQFLGDMCKQGEIEAGFDIARWWAIGTYLAEEFPEGSFGDPLAGWVQDAADCFTFDLTWSATVETSGSGGSNTVYLDLPGRVPDKDTQATQLINTLLLDHQMVAFDQSGQLNVKGGPFGACHGAITDSTMVFIMFTDVPNLGMTEDIKNTRIRSMQAGVSVNTSARVVCPDLQGAMPPVGEDFFWFPIRMANKGRSQNELWIFDLDMNDHTDGAIARFEEKGVKLPGDDSTYEVGQEFTVKPASAK
jgi:hypothetical protein